MWMMSAKPMILAFFKVKRSFSKHHRAAKWFSKLKKTNFAINKIAA
jgi:hypothetical protein